MLLSHLAFLSLLCFLWSTVEVLAQTANWKAQWEQVLAAAKKEGRVVVAGAPAPQYREGVTAFNRVYPDIKMEFVGVSGRDFAPRILAERRGDQFLWDVHLGGPETPNFQLKPNGVFDPLLPALILPEVRDDDVWVGGFADGWMDRERSFVYGFSGRTSPQVWVNRDAISEQELAKVEDLADPKWRGKISWNEPRRPGSGSAVAGYWFYLLGESLLRKVLSQDVVVSADLRQQTEWIVQKKYPIAVGLDDRFLDAYRKEGVGLNVKPLAFETPPGGSSRIGPGFGNVMLINRAPHLNTAKVVINWLLSREGQVAYVRATGINSRRLDVQEGPPETAPKRGVKYININKEELQPNIRRAIEMAKEIFR